MCYIIALTSACLAPITMLSNERMTFALGCWPAYLIVCQGPNAQESLLHLLVQLPIQNIDGMFLGTIVCVKISDHLTTSFPSFKGLTESST
jgi:hypothetical protein